MSARVYIFPPERRIGFIRRQVQAVGGYAPTARRNAIEGTLTRQRAAVAKLVGQEVADEYCDRLRREILSRLPSSGGRGERAS